MRSRCQTRTRYVGRPAIRRAEDEDDQKAVREHHARVAAGDDETVTIDEAKTSLGLGAKE